MTVQADFSRIKSLLQLTGLQQKDNRLYQVIRDLIAASEQQQAFVNQQIDSTSSGAKTTNITNQVLGFLEDSSSEERILATPTGNPPGTQGFFTNEVPTGNIDGSNKVFTLSRSYVAGTLDVYLNGVRQEITLDYTETNATQFTFVDAPLSGDTVLVDYGTTVAALKGDTGAPGIQGATGPAGTSAAVMPSEDGIDGEPSFIPGPRGLIGTTGPQGIPGLGLFNQDGQDGDTIVIPGKDGTIDGTASFAYPSGSQTITKLAETAITFDSTLFDTNAFFNIANPTRLTVPSGRNGKYIIVGQISFIIAGSSTFDIHLYKNGVKIADVTYAQTNTDTSLQACVVADLVTGDYIELKTIVDTGTSTVSTQGGSNETFLTLALCTGAGGSSTGLVAGTGISIAGSTISTVPVVGRVLIEEHDANNTAAFLDFTTRNMNGFTGNSFQSDFDEYELEMVGLYPVTNATGIYAWLRVITSGPTVQTTAYRYARWGVDSAGASGASASASAGAILLGTDLRNPFPSDPQFSAGFSGSLKIYAPLSTAIEKTFMGPTGWVVSTGAGNVRTMNHNGGWWGSYTALIGVRFLMDNSFLNTPRTIQAGSVRLYGIAK